MENIEQKSSTIDYQTSSVSGGLDHGPKAWTMGKLDLPFLLLLTMLALSTSCFAAEVLWAKVLSKYSLTIMRK